MKKFNEIFKDLRKKRGLLQIDIAADFSIDKSTISKWESGENTPTFETLQRIADYFNVSTDFLMGNEDEKQLIIEYRFNHAEIRAIIDEIGLDPKKYNALSPKEKKALRATVDAFIDNHKDEDNG